MIKTLTIVGTRPELIKLCRVISILDEHTEHVLVHTGQNYDYELNEIFFEDLGIRKPDHFLNVAGKNAAQTIANVIAKADEIIELEKPDAVLIYGDTNSCLSVISAKRRQVPVFHMEAGNRCFDQRVPEELNRKIVDHLSDINFVLTEHARRYLINEGVKPELIIKTGSHMQEVLSHHYEEIAASTILAEQSLEKGRYFVASLHREENVDSKKALTTLLDSINNVAEKYRLPVILSTHPRTRARISALEDIQLNENVSLIKPLGFFDYIKLQVDSFCVISDSGTLTEEASLLGFNGVMIREMHERPEGMDAGLLIMSGLQSASLLSAIKVTTDLDSCSSRVSVKDYDNPQVSSQILKCVLSYTEYVNKNIWKKY